MNPQFLFTQLREKSVRPLIKIILLTLSISQLSDLFIRMVYVYDVAKIFLLFLFNPKHTNYSRLALMRIREYLIIDASVLSSHLKCWLRNGEFDDYRNPLNILRDGVLHGDAISQQRISCTCLLKFKRLERHISSCR